MDIAKQERLNIKLVKEVEKYPCLFKSDSAEYCSRHITDKAWTDVGRVLGWSGPKCKEKFRNIRSVVGRYKKQIDSGAKKRPYYLMKHMRYAFPYIKSFQNSTDYKTASSHGMLLYEEIDLEEELHTEVKNETYGSPYPQSPLYYASTPSPSLETYPESPSPLPVSEIADKDQPRSSHSKDKPQSSGLHQSEQRNDTMETPSSHTDLAIELQNDPKKMFMLSLLPDVYAMNDKQTRKFKREVLKLVDDILNDV